MKNKLIAAAFAVVLTSAFACKEKAKPAEEASRPVMEKTEMTGPEYTSRYVCPMHCQGSGSDQPGKCPVCQMDYELNTETGQDTTAH